MSKACLRFVLYSSYFILCVCLYLRLYSYVHRRASYYSYIVGSTHENCSLHRPRSTALRGVAKCRKCRRFPSRILTPFRLNSTRSVTTLERFGQFCAIHKTELRNRITWMYFYSSAQLFLFDKLLNLAKRSGSEKSLVT